MDKSDPAWKLAQATYEAMEGTDKEALDRAFIELKPPARDIARAYALCLHTAPFASTEKTRLALNARLQVALMEEHVAAQQRMGRTMEILTWVLIWLTVLLGVFGIFEFFHLLAGRQ